jgi:sugar phosphate isomerase/epimerase
VSVAELCFNTFNRSAWHGIDPDLPAQIEAAAEAGFRLFGPDVWSIDAWTASGRRLDHLAALVSEAGLRCYELSGLNVTDRATTLADAEHVAELAAILRPEWILTNLGTALDAEACATFDEACVILAAAGCRPAVEYLPFTPANSIATAQVLVDHVGRDRAKILFDTWHHFRGPDTWADLEAAPLELVAYVQFDDALPMIGDDLVEETIMRRAFPGEGEFDLHRYCDVMRDKGFDGVVSIEILEAGWRARDDHREFARLAYESTARFWPQPEPRS